MISIKRPAIFVLGVMFSLPLFLFATAVTHAAESVTIISQTIQCNHVAVTFDVVGASNTDTATLFVYRGDDNFLLNSRTGLSIEVDSPTTQTLSIETQPTGTPLYVVVSVGGTQAVGPGMPSVPPAQATTPTLACEEAGEPESEEAVIVITNQVVTCHNFELYYQLNGVLEGETVQVMVYRQDGLFIASDRHGHTQDGNHSSYTSFDSEPTRTGIYGIIRLGSDPTLPEMVRAEATSEIVACEPGPELIPYIGNIGEMTKNCLDLVFTDEIASCLGRIGFSGQDILWALLTNCYITPFIVLSGVPLAWRRTVRRRKNE